MTSYHVQLSKGMSENVTTRTWQILSGRLQIPVICFTKFQVHLMMKIITLNKESEFQGDFLKFCSPEESTTQDDKDVSPSD